MDRATEARRRNVSGHRSVIMVTCMPRPVVVLSFLLVATLAGCSDAPSSGAPGSDRAAPERRAAASARLGAAGPADAPPGTAAARRIVFLGDSLTAGLGLPIEQAYPSLIGARLAARGTGWSVVNAGVSGDTSAGGVRRLEWSLDGGAAILVVALGANDALRGLPVDDLERNLDAIVAKGKGLGARVVLAGMEAPPNNGPEYTARFRQAYTAVAARHDVTLLPFLLDGVAGIAALNQNDGIHPNQPGAARVADTVWRVLDPIVRALEGSTTE